MIALWYMTGLKYLVESRLCICFHPWARRKYRLAGAIWNCVQDLWDCNLFQGNGITHCGILSFIGLTYDMIWWYAQCNKLYLEAAIQSDIPSVFSSHSWTNTAFLNYYTPGSAYKTNLMGDCRAPDDQKPRQSHHHRMTQGRASHGPGLRSGSTKDGCFSRARK